MERSGFAAGLVLGGLGGVLVGYLLSRNSDQDFDRNRPETIDLTPALKRNAASGSAVPAPVAEADADKE
jgi:hypothetical protein